MKTNQPKKRKSTTKKDTSRHPPASHSHVLEPITNRKKTRGTPEHIEETCRKTPEISKSEYPYYARSYDYGSPKYHCHHHSRCLYDERCLHDEPKATPSTAREAQCCGFIYVKIDLPPASPSEPLYYACSERHNYYHFKNPEYIRPYAYYRCPHSSYRVSPTFEEEELWYHDHGYPMVENARTRSIDPYDIQDHSERTGVYETPRDQDYDPSLHRTRSRIHRSQRRHTSHREIRSDYDPGTTAHECRRHHARMEKKKREKSQKLFKWITRLNESFDPDNAPRSRMIHVGKCSNPESVAGGFIGMVERKSYCHLYVHQFGGLKTMGCALLHISRRLQEKQLGVFIAPYRIGKEEKVFSVDTIFYANGYNSSVQQAYSLFNCPKESGYVQMCIAKNLLRRQPIALVCPNHRASKMIKCIMIIMYDIRKEYKLNAWFSIRCMEDGVGSQVQFEIFVSNCFKIKKIENYRDRPK